MQKAESWPDAGTAAAFAGILPSAFMGRSGGGLGMVWGRPDVGRARLCYSETYEVSNVARGAPVCPVQRRRGDGVSPASP